jgi:hypothetical protein
VIRRDAQAPDGSRRWALIPQIAHAHLAGDLADAWSYDSLPDDFLAALRRAARHHDDGWSQWDERPGVDRQGVPVNFDHMRLADSLSIWTRSIELSTIGSPLAGYLVAGHFCRLLERFDSWRSAPDTVALATEFLGANARKMEQLLSSWRPAESALVSKQLADDGVSFVQLFDGISLGVCTAERRDPWSVRRTGGATYTFTPLAPDRIRIEPWPLSVPHLTVHAPGRSVPQTCYATREALIAAPGEAVELEWELVTR